MIKSFIHLFAIGTFLLIMGCAEREEANNASFLLSANSMVFSAACSTDTIFLSGDAFREAYSDVDWITLPANWNPQDGRLPLYIQENGDGVMRKGNVVISDNNRRVAVRITQLTYDDDMVGPTTFSKAQAIGWGYDVGEAYADVSAVRGQIFDEQALRNSNEGAEVIKTGTQTITDLVFKKGESAETLEKEIAGRAGLGVDVGIAAVTINVEFSKQIKEQKERLYVWCRDIRAVKNAYFSNSVDLYDPEILLGCTTSSFRRSISQDPAKEIVRKYGTHLVASSLLGGKLDYYFTISRDVATEIEKVITTVNVRVLCFKSQATDVDEKTWADIKKDFEGSFKVSGGGSAAERLNSAMQGQIRRGEPFSHPELFDKWYECFKRPGIIPDCDLSMVDCTLIPIWDLIDDAYPSKAKDIKDYVLETYLK